ncbi:MAG: hypothetical protein ACXWCZ_09140, partial [Flavisolibacter sp.]
MALTDEQYKQLFRYVDGAMDAEEQKAFQDSLLHNKILNDESEFYKEIQLLIKSVEQKIENTIPPLSGEKKSKNEQVWTIISEARRNWESKYEHDLKLKYGITDKEKKISGDGQKNKIKRIPNWVVAAALVGIALSGA